MPGGIAPVDRDTAQACQGPNAGRSIPAGSGEAEIFYRLALGRVCYSYAREQLYFVHSSHVPVAQILSAALRGRGKTPVVEQLHLDPHGVLKGAQRVALSASDAEPVLTAMRLANIQITLLR
jgi:hypothetical protein